MRAKQAQYVVEIVRSRYSNSQFFEQSFEIFFRGLDDANVRQLSVTGMDLMRNIR